MKRMHNVGKIDRIVRISLALIVGVLHFTGILESRFFLFLMFLLIMTSLNQCCPLYAVFGLGTCGVKVDETATKIETEELNITQKGSR